MKRPLLTPLLLALLLGACLPQAGAPLITALPTEYIPTSIALTVQARTTPGPATQTDVPALPSPTLSGTPGGLQLPSPTPTSLLAEAIPTATATRTPRITVTPTHTPAPEIPAADVEITAPGALSKVVSPIPVRALLLPGDQGRVTVELIGEDERVIARQIVVLNPDLGRKAGLVVDLSFEIPGEAELARLAVYSQDAAGRITALSSVPLILLAGGSPDYNAVVDRLATVVIQEPLNDAIIQGGSVVITGLARPTTPLALVAELITETGQVVGQRVFDVAEPLPTLHLPFIVEVPYSVDQPTWVLLLVRERGERIPGITYLTSLEVLLSP